MNQNCLTFTFICHIGTSDEGAYGRMVRHGRRLVMCGRTLCVVVVAVVGRWERRMGGNGAALGKDLKYLLLEGNAVTLADNEYCFF